MRNLLEHITINIETIEECNCSSKLFDRSQTKTTDVHIDTIQYELHKKRMNELKLELSEAIEGDESGRSVDIIQQELLETSKVMADFEDVLAIANGETAEDQEREINKSICASC